MRNFHECDIWLFWNVCPLSDYISRFDYIKIAICSCHNWPLPNCYTLLNMTEKFPLMWDLVIRKFSSVIWLLIASKLHHFRFISDHLQNYYTLLNMVTKKFPWMTFHYSEIFVRYLMSVRSPLKNIFCPLDDHWKLLLIYWEYCFEKFITVIFDHSKISLLSDRVCKIFTS